MTLNPFTDLLVTVQETTNEATLYDATRIERLRKQLHNLSTSLHFKGDTTLSSLNGDASFTDTRNSLIFIARPSGSVLQDMVKLQARLRQVFARYCASILDDKDHGLWSTPSTDLHLTLLDIKSCKSAQEIDELVSIAAPHIASILDVSTDLITLDRPQVMVDQTAVAITFLPQGHVCYRAELWERCHSAGYTPEMRYVAASAHVTLMRFQSDLILTESAMSDLTRDISLINQDLRALEADKMTWTIRKADVQCVYGTVYYGGGTPIR